MKAIRNVLSLHRSGVTLPSAFLMPLRRRLRWIDDRIDLQGGSCITAPKDVPILSLYREIWVSRCYLHERSPIAEARDIIDVGANVGVFSVWAAKSYANARVLAVEPSTRMCSYLRGNIRDNGCENVVMINAACSGISGSATLYSPGSEVMNSLFPQDMQGDVFHAVEEVELVPLATIFERHSVRRGAFVKLDCEGAEYDILYGAPREVLERIDGIAMEYHLGFNQHRPRPLADFLATRGFEVSLGPLVCEDAGYLYAWRPR